MEHSESDLTLSGADKVAALLLSVDKSLADRIVMRLDNNDVKLIAHSASSLGSIPRSLIETLVAELVDDLGAGVDVVATLAEAEKLIDGVVPEEQAIELLAEINGDAGKAVWGRLSKAPAEMLAPLLSKEHPQAAAFVLSKMIHTASATVIGLLPLELRQDFTRRMVSISPATDAATAILEDTLAAMFSSSVQTSSDSDTHAQLAGILNKLDRTHMDEVLIGLEKTHPKEVKLVRSMLFTFEDITKLSSEACLRLFDEVPTERLILALNGADSAICDVVLASVSSRAKRMIEQELDSGATAVKRDIEKARRAIADLALDMADRGLIEINVED